MIRTILASATLALALAAPAKSQDIVDAAVGAGTFGMLVKAVEAAGLVETLKGEGPFTVFAPNEFAFAEIEEGGEFEELLMQPDRLTALLTYHVVPGKIMAADLTEGMTLTSVQGGTLTITLAGGAKVNGVDIVNADIPASNGVIHAIGTILTPPN